MLEWLIGHALNGLYSLLTKTLLKPMLWSGQQIRCAREEIRALDIRLYNAQAQSPGATPGAQFLQYRRKQLWIISLHALVWLFLLSSAAFWAGSAGALGALLIAVLVILGYLNVNVSGMPSRVQLQRK